MIIEMHSYLGYMIAIILTCLAVLIIVAIVLGIVAMTQDIIERTSEITSVFKQWRKSKKPNDFYHKNLDEAIKLCEDKADNYMLNLNEKAEYRTLGNWLAELKYLREDNEN